MKKRRYVPDLIADIAECDANYIRLRQVFPNMASEDGVEYHLWNRTPKGTGLDTRLNQQAATVTIKIKQRCPFTTVLSIRLLSDEGKPFIRWPSMELRVYHDVQSAEVVKFQQHRNFRFRYPVPNANMFQPDEKSQLNRFLGELLTHCLSQDYSSMPVDATF